MSKAFDDLVKRTTTKRTRTRAKRRAKELLAESVASEVGTRRRMARAIKDEIGASHEEAIIRELRGSPTFVVAYLNAALEDSNEPHGLLAALCHVVEAREAEIERGHLNRAFSRSGGPPLSAVVALLKAIGFKLTVENA